MNLVSGIILGILFLLFLYFGYRDDYNRDKGDFWRTLISMPLGFLFAVIGLGCYTNRLRDWANNTPSSNKNCDIS